MIVIKHYMLIYLMKAPEASCHCAGEECHPAPAGFLGCKE